MKELMCPFCRDMEMTEIHSDLYECEEYGACVDAEGNVTREPIEDW